ncbi:MAG: hypothetical protein QOG96_1146, partial [Pseudonocardiales bacterium]|nr:hypothetical protein [Pseudonocardiales bacterium]
VGLGGHELLHRRTPRTAKAADAALTGP